MAKPTIDISSHRKRLDDAHSKGEVSSKEYRRIHKGMSNVAVGQKQGFDYSIDDKTRTFDAKKDGQDAKGRLGGVTAMNPLAGRKTSKAITFIASDKRKEEGNPGSAASAVYTAGTRPAIPSPVVNISVTPPAAVAPSTVAKATPAKAGTTAKPATGTPVQTPPTAVTKPSTVPAAVAPMAPAVALAKPPLNSNAPESHPVITAEEAVFSNSGMEGFGRSMLPKQPKQSERPVSFTSYPQGGFTLDEIRNRYNGVTKNPDVPASVSPQTSIPSQYPQGGYRLEDIQKRTGPEPIKGSDASFVQKYPVGIKPKTQIPQSVTSEINERTRVSSEKQTNNPVMPKIKTQAPKGFQHQYGHVYRKGNVDYVKNGKGEFVLLTANNQGTRFYQKGGRIPRFGNGADQILKAGQNANNMATNANNAAWHLGAGKYGVKKPENFNMFANRPTPAPTVTTPTETAVNVPKKFSFRDKASGLFNQNKSGGKPGLFSDTDSLINTGLGVFGALGGLTNKAPQAPVSAKANFRIRPATGDPDTLARMKTSSEETYRGTVRQLRNNVGSDSTSYVRGVLGAGKNKDNARFQAYSMDSQIRIQDRQREDYMKMAQDQTNNQLANQDIQTKFNWDAQRFGQRAQGAQAMANSALQFGVNKRANMYNNKIAEKNANAELGMMEGNLRTQLINEFVRSNGGRRPSDAELQQMLNQAIPQKPTLFQS
jgi:hypothetical protein